MIPLDVIIGSIPISSPPALEVAPRNFGGKFYLNIFYYCKLFKLIIIISNSDFRAPQMIGRMGSGASPNAAGTNRSVIVSAPAFSFLKIYFICFFFIN